VDASHTLKQHVAGRVSPVFFYTGNEGAIEEFAENTGLLDELAPRFGALVVFCEHRYYGKSLPFGPGTSGSFARDKIGKLSVEQALADYAMLLPRIKAKFGLSDSSPTIAFGGSYGGMLSAWMRLRYLALVDGAIAASAPMKFAVGSPATPGFYEAVSLDLQGADPACPERVRLAFSQLLALARPDDASGEADASRKVLAHRLRLCDDELSRGQVQHLLAWARNAFVVLGMCDYPYPASFLAPLPAWPIEAACRLMKQDPAEHDALGGLPDSQRGQSAQTLGSGQSGWTHLDGLAAVTALVYNASAKPPSLAAHVRVKTGCGLGDTARAWDYQVCTEISLLVSTDNVTDPFPPYKWGASELATYCQKTWGVTPRPGWAQVSFGGTASDPARGLRSGGSNIVFSNGLLDPWHGGGFLENVSESMPAVILKRGAHHLDLRYSDARDPPGAVQARAREAEMIEQWLQQASKRAEDGGQAR
ncbi:peptidase S28, partial [Pavlovales sp. CCMP2436]